MASKNNQILQRNPTETKNFAYSKGSVTLNFSLRVDIKSELKDFLELLQAGEEDVKKELALRFPKK